MNTHETFPIPIEWLTDLDRTLVQTVKRWAEQELISKRHEGKEDFDALLAPALKKLFIDIGLQNLVGSEDSGGSELDSPDLAMTGTTVLEQVARGDVGMAYLLANSLVTQSALGTTPHRNDDLLVQLAPYFGDQNKPAICALILPDYGNNNAAAGLSPQIVVNDSGNDQKLTGKTVRPQCAATDASLFAILCQTKKGEPALAIVPADSDNIRIGKPIKSMGLAASRNADVDFDSVAISNEHLVFKGQERTQALLAQHNLFCCAIGSGALLACYEILAEWGKVRVIKGKGQVFKDNPLTAALMGDVGRRISISRTLTYQLARNLSAPKTYGAPGSNTNYTFSIATAQTVLAQSISAINSAMELMASAGYATEWQLERYWRDTKALECCLGPTTALQTQMAAQYFESNVR